MGVYVRSRGPVFTWGDGAVQPAAMCPMYVLKKGLGKAAMGGARGKKRALGRWEQRGGQGLPVGGQGRGVGFIPSVEGS